MPVSGTRMAEINPSPYRFKAILTRFLIYAGAFLMLSVSLVPQDISSSGRSKKRIDIRNADTVYIVRDKQTKKEWHRLLGNISMTHKEITMKCDSAHFFPDKNQVIAYSRIHIEQGDTLDIYGDYLFYDGSLENAMLNGNVILIDKETSLYTNAVTYDVKNEIAQYNDHGRITNGKNELTSKSGTYYVSQTLFHFKDSVKIVNPDYEMHADTMDYNTETETAIFTGPSEMKGDSIYMYCEKGWYDTKNNLTRVWQNAVIDNKQQIIYGDSLYYDDNTGYGESFGNITIADTSDNILVKGEYAWYFKKPERFMVTDSAMFIQYSDQDSLFLHADTITAKTISDTSSLEYRLMRAYHGCRVFSADLQIKCDSLSYSFQDSVIRLYHDPVLWSEENQLTSDSMAIFTKNRQADRMELYNSAFVASQVDSLRFNQIKGRDLTGYFRENKLYKINVEGNGESIFYIVDGENLIGVNKAKCARIEIIVENGKIKEIFEYQNPEGIIDPPVLSPKTVQNLEGFTWQDIIRPKKVQDIFK
jgi:lipopolysaccharide export system protein LptA